MAWLSDRIASVYRDAAVKLPPRAIVEDTASMYNQLLELVIDVANREEVSAAMPLLEFRLKKRISEAVAEPGSGKRSA